MPAGKRISKAAIVAILLIVIILVGEAYVYVQSGLRYDSSAERVGEHVDYSVYTSGSKDYTSILFDNHGNLPFSEIVIYEGDTYDRFYDEARQDTWIYNSTKMVDQIEIGIKIRGLSVRTVGVSELISVVSDISDAHDHAILCMSYALPSEVYTGNPSDPIFNWMNSGGSLYWVCSQVGRFYTTQDSLVKVENNQELFFGNDSCININGPEMGFDKRTDQFTALLNIKNNYIRFGIDPSKITSDHLSIGYSNGRYSSITLMEYGSGMIGVFGGGFQLENVDDICQVICSKICPVTTISDHECGKVTRSTLNGTLDGTGDTVYIFIGNTYQEYARVYDVRP